MLPWARTHQGFMFLLKVTYILRIHHDCMFSRACHEQTHFCFEFWLPVLPLQWLAMINFPWLNSFYLVITWTVEACLVNVLPELAYFLSNPAINSSRCVRGFEILKTWSCSPVACWVVKYTILLRPRVTVILFIPSFRRSTASSRNVIKAFHWGWFEP